MRPLALGIVEDRARRTGLHYLALVEEDNFVGDARCEAEIVRGHHHGRALAGEVAENLEAFVTSVIESLRVRVPFLMMAWSNRSAQGIQDLICEVEPPSFRIIRLLSAYLDGEIRRGRLRRVDAEIAARGLVGSIMEYVMSEILHGATHGLPLPAPMFVRGLVDIFLHGTAAPVPAPSRRIRRH